MKRKDHVYLVNGNLKTKDDLVEVILYAGGDSHSCIECKEWRYETSIEV